MLYHVISQNEQANILDNFKLSSSILLIYLTIITLKVNAMI